MISNRRRITNEYKAKVRRIITIQGDLVTHPHRTSNEFHELNHLFLNLVEDSDGFFQEYSEQIIESGILPHAWSNIRTTRVMQTRADEIRNRMNERNARQRVYRTRQRRRRR